MPNPKNLKSWKKGQSGNPQGGRLHNKAIKNIRNLTNQELARVGSIIVQGKIGELRAIIDKGNDANVLEAMIASVCIGIVTKKDANALNALMDRLAGKIPQRLESTGKDGEPLNQPQVIVTIPSNGRD